MHLDNDDQFDDDAEGPRIRLYINNDDQYDDNDEDP